MVKSQSPLCTDSRSNAGTHFYANFATNFGTNFGTNSGPNSTSYRATHRFAHSCANSYADCTTNFISYSRANFFTVDGTHLAAYCSACANRFTLCFTPCSTNSCPSANGCTRQ